MNFEEWKSWKEKQTQLTCDYIGCQRQPIWKLPLNHVHFCVEHGALLGGIDGMAKQYSETPRRL